MAKLTRRRLKQLLRYNKKTGIFCWLEVRHWKRPKNSIAGSVMKNGYVGIGIEGKKYYAHRLACLYVLGYWPPRQLDHRDGNRVNNIWTNLRQATNSQNHRNQLKGGGRASIFKGVTRLHKNKKWMAYIKYDGVFRYLGSFERDIDAALAYDYAAIKNFGRFAKTNAALGLL